MPVAAYVLLSAAALLFVLAVLIRARLRAGRPAALDVELLEPSSGETDSMDAAFKALLAETPDDCLVHNLLAEWSQGKSCALCSKELAVGSDPHGPALISPERVTSEWSEVRVEEIPKILTTHQPICWDCHIIEMLYRMHPEMITERDPK